MWKQTINLIWSLRYFLPHLKAGRFFRNLEVLNPGIKSVKNLWNLKRIWITPKSLPDFRAYCQVFAFVRNNISNIVLQETCSAFWLPIIRLGRLFCLLFLSIRMIALCVVWALEVMNIYESLKVLNSETVTLWNWRVWLIAKSLTIFFNSVVESQRRFHAMTQNSVIVCEINKGLFHWGEWHAISGHI